MEYRKVKDLVKLEGNPRTISDEQFAKLCQSIEKLPQYFEAHPIILSPGERME
jgi:tartrate dehydratase beta subunit/fumarate hydratase class I family protein